MSLIFYDLDGNEISSDKWADSIVAGVVRATIEQYQVRATESVAKMVCSTHGGVATLTFNVSGSAEEPKIDIQAKACCDEFAQEAIQEAFRSWSTS